MASVVRGDTGARVFAGSRKAQHARSSGWDQNGCVASSFSGSVIERLLRSQGIGPDALLGRGGEASVYALDDVRVVRVPHHRVALSGIRDRQALVEELASRGAPFGLPTVLEVGEFEGLAFAVERRLPGISVFEQLRRLEEPARARLIERHLEAAAALGGLQLEARGWYGDLIAEEPIRTRTWREYLEARVAQNLQRSTPALRAVDPVALAGDLPDTDRAAFVHLDAFGGNMLTADGEISAVLDIGTTSVAGDRRLDPLAAAVYLSSPEISGAVTRRDLLVARSWLRAADLDDWFEPTRRWLAAYWSFALDDRPLQAWCNSVLLNGR
jgi:aminoglycoside phosphotransferase (APT) family kinase protein